MCNKRNVVQNILRWLVKFQFWNRRQLIQSNFLNNSEAGHFPANKTGVKILHEIMHSGGGEIKFGGGWNAREQIVASAALFVCWNSLIARAWSECK